MNEQTTREQLAAAKRRLALALRRLEKIRVNALYGDYDAAQLDEAIEEYRHAAADHKTAAAQMQRETRGLAVWDEPEFDEALRRHPTNRMRFVKWLVETGRLTDS